MSVNYVLSFCGIDRKSRSIVEQTVRLLPSLSGGLLESCDVGVRPDSASLLLRARLSEAPGAAAAIERLSAWTVLAHGSVLGPLGEPAPPGGPASPLDATELVGRRVAPEGLPAVLDRAFLALGADPAAPDDGAAPEPPAELHPARREHARIRYDARRRELSLPSELALAAGHRLTLAVHSAMTDSPVVGVARVVKVRRPAGARGRARGRFLVLLAPEDESLHAAFVLAGAEEATIQIVSAAASPPRHRVLLVDVVSDRLSAIVDAFRDDGFDVGFGMSDHEGRLEPAALAGVDVVVLMSADPERAGIVLRALRANEPGDVPVLLASAAPPAVDPGLLRAGADAVIAASSSAGELVRNARSVAEGTLPAVAPPSSGQHGPAGVPPAAPPHARA